MNQRSFAVVACTVLFVCATESTAAAKPCTPPHAVYGLIGDTYNRIGASDGPLGCPTSDEMDHPEGKGRYQFFENGQIGWSPTTGDRSMQIAYRQGNQIIFEWGDTSPFNYDFFEISWTNGPAQAGTNVKGGPRTGGRYAIPVIDLGTYRIGIKGCHNPPFLGTAHCNEPWTNSLYVIVSSHARPPFDLIWQGADPVGFPLNANWNAQSANPRQSTPNADEACFSNDNGERKAHFDGVTCTSQNPSIDQPVFPSANWVSCNVGKTTPIPGHVNWRVATYTGTVQWDGKDFPDEDYNFLLNTPDLAAVSAGNVAAGEQQSIALEFYSNETIDRFATPWWNGFHRAVDNDNARASSMVEGKHAIVTGLLGLDCVHGCKTELHPVYAMAIHVKDDPSDDVWAIFVRNWGQEGWCSHHRHIVQQQDFVFHLPWREKSQSVFVLNRSDDSDRQFLTNTIAVTGPRVTWAKGQGVDVAFHLPVASGGDDPFINGELHLKWSAILGSAKTQIAEGRNIGLGAVAGTQRSRNEPVSAGRKRLGPGASGEVKLAQAYRDMTPDQRARARSMPQVAREPVGNTIVSGLQVAEVPNLSHPVLPTPTVRMMVDAQKAIRDQQNVRILCAAYNSNVPGLPNLCTPAATEPQRP